MSTKKRHQAGRRFSWIHSSRLHVVLYSFLLVLTPFVLLQNFLVELISKVSSSAFTLADLQIPILPCLAVALLVVFVIVFRSRISRTWILASVLAAGMIALAQQVTDFYFDHNFYDLQQNWHYIAYGIFAYMVYRDLAPRGLSRAMIILITFFAALLFSSFDEVFQKFMSSRVFDISDIAKDVWGALTGIVMIHIVCSQPHTLLANLKKIRQTTLRGYLRNPTGLLVFLLVLAFLFLSYSSLMTDFEYWYIAALFTLGSFVILFALFHLSRFKGIKYGLISILAALVIIQACFFVKYRTADIVYNSYGLTVYKGVPIPFFDVMIYPDGFFRLVDKKHYLYQRDKAFFLKQRTDIILIASGKYGLGGRGFTDERTMFMYNPNIHRGTQVIILKTAEACRVFNMLRQEGKNVLFILHNTC
jgi:VanZ family protein